MDLRSTSLLLLLLYASGACCRTTGNGPRLEPRHYHAQRRRSGSLLQRPVRAISEFLEPPPPPPPPANHRQPRGPLLAASTWRQQRSNGPSRQPTAALSPGSAPRGKQQQQARNARYAESQSADPGYLGKLINWLNPFGGVDANAGDARMQGSSSWPQYAPQMPYAGAAWLHHPPPQASTPPFPLTSAWAAGQGCNPCDAFPWTPVIRNDVQPAAAQYAAHFGSDNYLAPPPAQQPGEHSATRHLAAATQRPHADPHLSLSPTPPLYQAKPFHRDYHASSSFDQAPSPSFLQQQPLTPQHLPAAPLNLDHLAQANAPAHQQQHYDIQVHESPIIDVEQQQEHRAAATVEASAQQQQQHDADQAESRPVEIESAYLGSSASTPTRAKDDDDDKEWRGGSGATNVHFQRSPLVELSVAGEQPADELETERSPTKAKARVESSSLPPRASVINYIVTSPLDASTTAATSTVRSIDQQQQQQESRVETLVQALEFNKNRSHGAGLNQTATAARPNAADNEDVSASREAVAPSKPDSEKKIIIPYTSQYTPSPFHPTKALARAKQQQQQQRQQPDNHRPEETTLRAQLQLDNSVEDDSAQESKRVSVTRPPELALRNNHTAAGNAIDVHRLQKNIDNWTIQEYSKKASLIRNLINATYPRWISSKQIPDEYLLAAATDDDEDSNEYYEFSQEAQSHRGTNAFQVTTTTTTTTTSSSTTTTEATTKVNVVNAVYPKSTRQPEPQSTRAAAAAKSRGGEKVYVVTPIPNPNSLEVSGKDHREGRLKAQRVKEVAAATKVGVEQAYQVLPQAVNNLAVLANAPESAAPALWGIMEHEQFASIPNQPRWRSESDDVLPEPASTPILYAGHSKIRNAYSSLELLAHNKDALRQRARDLNEWAKFSNDQLPHV